MSTTQIIRTVEELEALDPETVLLDTTGYLVRTRGLVMNGKPQAFLPASVVASGEQVREARKALEEAKKKKENSNG